MDAEIPTLDFKIEHGSPMVEKDIAKLLCTMKPEWSSENIIIKNLKGGGFVNQLFCCYEKSDVDKTCAVVVRLAAENRLYTIRPEDEKVGLKLAQMAGCSPKCLALFEGGFVQEFINSKQLDYITLYNDNYSKQLGRLIASLHARKEDHAKLHDVIQQPTLFRRLNKLISLVKQEPSTEADKVIISKHNMSKDNLLKEYSLLKQCFNPSGMELVYGHNDLQSFNILCSKETDDLYLVDYELSGMNYDAYEFTYMRWLMEDFKILDLVSDNTPTKTDEKRLYRYYLEAKSDIEKGHHDSVDDQKVEAFYQRTNYMQPIYHFYVILFACLEMEYNHIKIPKNLLHRELEFHVNLYLKTRHFILGDKGVI